MERAKYTGPRMPNGWPVPSFMYVDGYSDLCIEWVFGDQSDPSRWRLSFFTDREDPRGSYAFLTAEEGGRDVTLKEMDEILKGA